jgi:hypothetical protein
LVIDGEVVVLPTALHSGKHNEQAQLYASTKWVDFDGRVGRSVKV